MWRRCILACISVVVAIHSQSAEVESPNPINTSRLEGDDRRARCRCARAAGRPITRARRDQVSSFTLVPGQPVLMIAFWPVSQFWAPIFLVNPPAPPVSAGLLAFPGALPSDVPVTVSG